MGLRIMSRSGITLAILQARVSSTRLPGKVLLPILGQPMILRQIERVRRARLIDRLVVATSDDPADDEIDNLCRVNDLSCFRGSLDDVLDRFYQAARPYQPSNIVRLTGDCPLTDPSVIDRLIHFHCEGDFDYSTNAIEPTFPDGLDVEIFRSTCLSEALQEAVLPSEREHVTSFFHRQPLRYKIGIMKNDTDLSKLRWTVDEREDFLLVTRIYEELYPRKPDFTTNDILHFLNEHQELLTMNIFHKRNEGLEKSRKEDRKRMASKGEGE